MDRVQQLSLSVHVLFSHVLALCWLYYSVALSSLRIASQHSHPPISNFFLRVLFGYIFLHLFIYLFLHFPSSKPSGSSVTGACQGLAREGGGGLVAGL